MTSHKKISGWFFILPILIALYFPVQCAAAILDRQLHDDRRCSFKSRPGSNYQAITTLPKGVKINVIGRDGYWLKVESKHGGRPGYVDEQFARPEASPPAGATTSGFAVGRRLLSNTPRDRTP